MHSRPLPAEAVALHQPPGDPKVHLVVVHDEDIGVRGKDIIVAPVGHEAGLPARGEVADGLVGYDALFYIKAKNGPGAVHAGHVQRGAHHLEKVVGDGDAQTGALDVAGAAFLDPLERVVELAHVLFLDADAGIGDGHMEHHGVAVQGGGLDGHGDGALFRVFHGVGEQVDDDLLESHVVAEESGREVMVHVKDERQPLFGGPVADDIDKIVDHGGRTVLDGEDLHFAAFDLGEV